MPFPLRISTTTLIDPRLCDKDNISGSSPLPAKTECAFKGLESLLAQGVPLDGLGIQSHLAAVPNQFPSKADAHFTYDRLAKMGLVGAITELDIWVPGELPVVSFILNHRSTLANSS
jgi:GH35 family endo-1,4-beta-xylanase